MGMYTELHFNVELKPDTPAEVLTILRYMLGAQEGEPPLPSHPLFHTERWRSMLRCDSYYFSADTCSTLRLDRIADTHFLCVRCNLKNYDAEIEHFIDWIEPFVNKDPGDFLGFFRYEETEQPTLIHKRQR